MCDEYSAAVLFTLQIRAMPYFIYCLYLEFLQEVPDLISK